MSYGAQFTIHILCSMLRCRPNHNPRIKLFQMPSNMGKSQDELSYNVFILFITDKFNVACCICIRVWARKCVVTLWFVRTRVHDTEALTHYVLLLEAPRAMHKCTTRWLNGVQIYHYEKIGQNMVKTAF